MKLQMEAEVEKEFLAGQLLEKRQIKVVQIIICDILIDLHFIPG